MSARSGDLFVALPAGPASSAIGELLMLLEKVFGLL